MSKPDNDPVVYRVGIVRQDMGFDPLYVANEGVLSEHFPIQLGFAD